MSTRTKNQRFFDLRSVTARGLVYASLTFSFVAGPAFAQDDKDNANTPETFSLDIETPFSDANDLTSIGPQLDLGSETLGSQIFDLDLSDVNCITGEEACLKRDDSVDMLYSKSLTTSILDKGGLDIELTPRASVSFNDGSSSALVGALVKIGDDLKDGDEFKSNTWYVFAGADAEALTYAPNDINRVTMGDFHLQERIIVGDAQAGVGYRLNDSTDISLGYFRREVTSFGNETDMQSTSFTEDAAAVSFTWRR